MNKEIIHEGYLIKSPPTKFWRARWCRRWFILRQGEIPGQFHLEYYTDRNCRKLKGMIDLDQCERVDSGLRLQHRKQKFQNMFDVKIPRRTYYLAADSEADMNDWVACICQVCNLQDLSNIGANRDTNRKHYNVGSEAQLNKRTYQRTVISSQSAVERSQSVRIPNIPNDQSNGFAWHTRASSLVEMKLTIGKTRKIPENLKLSECFVLDNPFRFPSSALSTSSGPYIPISECFSGSPGTFDSSNPVTPWNSLEPKNFDTPRSHINIGLKLTNDQPYSPKRNNCTPSQPRPRSSRSGPTYSESVFTDDEDWTHQSPHGPIDRSLQPYDSSIENDSIVIIYAQHFSRLPADEKTSENNHVMEKRRKPVSSRPPKRKNIPILEDVERNEEIHVSDPENASPAIGLKDISCCVENSYDIPRSHQLPYYNLNENNFISPTLIDRNQIISTPNLSTEQSVSATSTIPRRSHFYSNAVPSKMDGNVFRYDFVEQENAPVVDRGLKPKAIESKPTVDGKEQPDLVQSSKHKSTSSFHLELRPPPPCDRKLKPSIPKFDTRSLRWKGAPFSPSTDTALYSNHSEADSKTLPRNYNNPLTSLTLTKQTVLQPQPQPVAKPVGHLEYSDLDHLNSPPICNTNSSKTNSASTSNSTIAQRNFQTHVKASEPDPGPNVNYKSIDFVKTGAINRTRQDSEKNRNEKKTSNKD